jgi:LysM repeat protein
MMRPRVVLILSLAANVLLLVLWLARHGSATPPATVEATDGLPATPEVRTNVQVFRQYFSWADVESEDYTTYIENLRRIGCPEQTIRDIIVADVDHLYRESRSAELLPTTRQWWQSQPDSRILDQATEQRKALARERYALLTRLLGEGWDTAAMEDTPTVAIEVPLDGPLLGVISPEKQREIQLLSGQTQRRYEAILREAERRGEAPDAAAMAQVYQDLKAGLASLLSPAQLEEFGMRYSPIAHQLRDGLAELEFALTPTEFRTLYRAAEPFELQLLAMGEETPSNAVRRRGLLQQRELAFRNALGPARYREYQASQDPAYRSAVAAAEAAGTPQAAPFLQAIGVAGEEVATAIEAVPGASDLERQIELKRVELEQLEAAAAVLGQPVPSNEPPLPPRKTYAFERGESIADVSRKTGVPVAVLLQANPGLQINNNPAGTTIVIPPWTPPPGLR